MTKEEVRGYLQTYCGVCVNYRYEVAAKGRCKWPAYNASQMRPACKRFVRVNEKTEL